MELSGGQASPGGSGRSLKLELRAGSFSLVCRVSTCFLFPASSPQRFLGHSHSSSPHLRPAPAHPAAQSRSRGSSDVAALSQQPQHVPVISCAPMTPSSAARKPQRCTSVFIPNNLV
ncbi:unnamed protein product [Pleuronectes platessa]|uniref:Uncharacterized protein n=1 Tax=Pleuronectes platessa TaxID=8262 RepID=A0A9N7VGW3_PLEPL|nr:unnamed protein product [Pleuronectes platessa]